MAKIINHNRLTGGLDQDSLSQDVNFHDYRYSLNIRNGVAYIKKKGGATLVKGNVLVPLTYFPYGTLSGKSKTIGSYEDKEFETIIFFVWNENTATQSIFRYFPNLISAGNPFGEIHQIAMLDFGWKPNTKITSINTISGKSGTLLYWCDNVQGRRLNITKSDLIGKFKTWDCYLPKSFSTFQTKVGLDIYSFGRGSLYEQLIIDTTTQTQISTIGEYFAYVANVINTDSIASVHLLAEACDCSMTLTDKKANGTDITFGTVAGQPPAPIMAVPANWYGDTITERFVDEAVYPSYLSPIVTFGVNSAKQFNNVKNQVWQFRTGYLTTNFEEAVFSPWTQVPVNELVNDGLQIQNYNYLHIDFNDATIVPNLTLIQHMEVNARSGNLGVEQQVAQLNICDFIDYNFTTNQWICTYDFYNDTIANSVDPIKAQQLESGVPIINAAQDIVQNRLVKGNITSGRDPIDCLDISVSQDFQSGDDVYRTVTVDVVIMNVFYQDNASRDSRFFVTTPQILTNTPPDSGQCIGVMVKYQPTSSTNIPLYEQYPQWGGIPPTNSDSSVLVSDKSNTLEQLSPLGGFVGYVAGTNNFSISDQILLQNGVPYNGIGISSGTVLDASNISAIRDFLAKPNISVIHRIKLKVKEGTTAIIRLASHWCSFGDVLSKGPMYNLYNGTEYQTTSTQVFGTYPANPSGGLGSFDFYRKELTVEVGNADIYGGEFVVEDCRQIKRFTESTGLINDNPWNAIIAGYLVDGVLGSSPLSLRGAPSIEAQAVFFESADYYPFYGGIPIPQISYSIVIFRSIGILDHNGYFYTSVAFRQNRAAHLNVGSPNNDIPTSIRVFNTNYLNPTSNPPFGGTTAIPPELYDNSVQIPYGSASVLSDKQAGTLILYNTYIPTGFSTQVTPFNGNFSHQELLLVLDDVTLSTQISAEITGEVVDFNGSPITNAVIVYQKTGRFGITDSNGFFRLLIYATVTNINSLPSSPERIGNDVLIAMFDNQTAILSNNNQQINFVNFSVYNNTSSGIPFPLPFSPTLLANANPFGKSLKRGGTYQIGIRYKDSAGRLTTVITNQASIVYIPFTTEDLHNYFPNQYPVGTFRYGKPTITITLNFSPPEWAVSYDILLTKNQYETSYLQWVANEITYVSTIGFNQAQLNVTGTTTTTSSTTGGITTSTAVTTPTEVYNPPTISSYLAGDATNIYISMTNLVDYKNANPTSILNYVYQAGDRIRLIADNNGVFYNDLYELDVEGYDSNLNAIIVQNSSSIPQLYAGTLFEVLHVRQISELDEQIFYEVGESFLCTAPNTLANAHSVNPIVLTCGDTYHRRRQYLVNDVNNTIFFSTSYVIEDANLSDFFVSDSWDIGRTGINDPFDVQTTESTEVIVSDTYQTNSNSNGFCNFQGLNSKILSKQYGAIMRLIMLGDVLHVICTNKSISDYIGQAILTQSKSLDGPVAIANDFLGTNRAQVKDIGTQDPASVDWKDGYIYGLDESRALAWRDANDGMTEISKIKMQSYFKQLCDGGLFSVTAGIDKYYNEYILTTQKLITSQQVVHGANTTTIQISLPADQAAQVESSTSGYMKIRFYNQITLSWVEEYFAYTISNQNILSFSFITGGAPAVQIGDAIFIYYGGETDTIAWNEDENLWKAHYSFVPDCYGSLNDLLYSYQNGQIWVHDQNPVHNNFYGQQYISTINPVFNASPSAIKFWLALTMEMLQADGNNAWYADITNDYGQVSKLVSQNFRLKERQWAVDFKRDMTDTSVSNPWVNGKRLRSEALTVALSTNYTDEVYIRALMVLAEMSMLTGR